MTAPPFWRKCVAKECRSACGVSPSRSAPSARLTRAGEELVSASGPGRSDNQIHRTSAFRRKGSRRRAVMDDPIEVEEPMFETKRGKLARTSASGAGDRERGENARRRTMERA